MIKTKNSYFQNSFNISYRYIIEYEITYFKKQEKLE